MKREFIVPIDYIGETPPGNEELVRCKNCKHRNDDFPCELHTVDGSAHDDWYCADGERKE